MADFGWNNFFDQEIKPLKNFRHGPTDRQSAQDAAIPAGALGIGLLLLGGAAITGLAAIISQNVQNLPVISPTTATTPGCTSNADCEALDASKPICSVPTGMCSRCNIDLECSYSNPNRPICNKAVGSCDACTADFQCKNSNMFNIKCNTATGSCKQDCQCGKTNSKKIINGDVTQINEFPWVTSIILRLPFGDFFTCGGSVISSQEILTAAHCVFLPSDLSDFNSPMEVVSPSTLVAVTGNYLLDTVDSGEKVRTVCKVTPYSTTDTDLYIEDYAVLTLCEPILFSKEVAPVCLPDTQGPGTKYEDQPAVINGWGRTNPFFLNETEDVSNVLQKGVVTTLTNPVCCGPQYDWDCSFLTESSICAKNSANQDVCVGDSGGGLLVKESSGFYTQVGIVSFGGANGYCNDPRAPSVYARVSRRLNWIKDQVTGTYC